tara:strand:- start:5595 stop:7679 length:2085 start_codon:yes stop_codon:yes gene_type:complete
LLHSIPRRTLKICLIVFSVFVSSSASAQAWEESTCAKAARVLKVIEELHFAPKSFNDSLSAEIFTLFTKGLDADGSFFTEKDIQSLDLLVPELYRQIKDSTSCEFIAAVNLIYGQRLQSFATLIEASRQQTLDLKTRANFKEKTTGQNFKEQEWQSYWQNYFQMRVLFALDAGSDSLVNAGLPSSVVVQAVQTKVAEGILCRLQDRIKREDLRLQYLEEEFLDAVTKVFGPHNSYFNREQEQDFKVSLAVEARSFGFDFYRNDLDQLEISNVNPGGSAWNSNALNEGDVIVSINTGTEEISEFNCLSTSLLRSQLGNSEKLEIVVRKKSGEESSIVLESSVSAVEENRIQSFILAGTRKIGYIYLPSFYVGDEESEIVSGCATDIARILIRLKREGIEGLILDLRDNGGGMMGEAIRMAGLFVNYGALSIYWDGKEAPLTLKDPDKGVVYNDPLIVMINSFSASASELFAAALQDHIRAIIVGSPSYGKATVQQVIPISFAANTDEGPEPDGALKLTLAAFYRATGSSHQKEGVIPHIHLPDFSEALPYREVNEHYALENRPIVKKTYYTRLPDFPTESLVQKSQSRLAVDSSWMGIKSLQLKVKEWDEGPTIPLGYSDFRAYLNQNDLQDDFDAISFETSLYTIERPAYLKELATYGLGEELEQSFQIESISEDIYIQESYLIMNDFLTTKTK